MIRPAADYFPCRTDEPGIWGPWIAHGGSDRPSYIKTDLDLGRPGGDVAIYVTERGGGWGRNWSPPWPDIRWFRLRREHPFYVDFFGSIERRCVDIADQAVSEYRHGQRSYSCTGHTAKRWQAAYDGARLALGGDPE